MTERSERRRRRPVARPGRPRSDGAVDGEPGRSVFEADVVRNAKRRGIEFGYETEKLGYQLKPSKYTPDLVLATKDAGDVRAVFAIEVKGNLTKEDRVKLLAVKDQHPHSVIKLLFQKNNKITPRSKTRYLAWAEQHGFDAVVGKAVPERWVEEAKEWLNS